MRLPLRNPLAWRLVTAFFLMSFVFYGLNSWLPDVYVERGWSQSAAGGLLAVMNTLTIPVGFVVAWAADHRGTRRMWLAAAAALQLASLDRHRPRALGRMALGGVCSACRSDRSSR